MSEKNQESNFVKNYHRSTLANPPSKRILRNIITSIILIVVVILGILIPSGIISSAIREHYYHSSYNDDKPNFSQSVYLEGRNNFLVEIPLIDDLIRLDVQTGEIESYFFTEKPSTYVSYESFQLSQEFLEKDEYFTYYRNFNNQSQINIKINSPTYLNFYIRQGKMEGKIDKSEIDYQTLYHVTAKEIDYNFTVLADDGYHFLIFSDVQDLSFNLDIKFKLQQYNLSTAQESKTGNLFDQIIDEYRYIVFQNPSYWISAKFDYQIRPNIFRIPLDLGVEGILILVGIFILRWTIKKNKKSPYELTEPEV